MAASAVATWRWSQPQVTDPQPHRPRPHDRASPFSPLTNASGALTSGLLTASRQVLQPLDPSAAAERPSALPLRQ